MGRVYDGHVEVWMCWVVQRTYHNLSLSKQKMDTWNIPKQAFVCSELGIFVRFTINVYPVSSSDSIIATNASRSALPCKYCALSIVHGNSIRSGLRHINGLSAGRERGFTIHRTGGHIYINTIIL